MMTNVKEIGELALDEEIQTAEGALVVEFSAEWCPPCKVLAPVLDSIAADYGDRIRIVRIDSDDHPEISARYQVMSVPTLLVFADGEVQTRLVGARSRRHLVEELAPWISPLSEGLGSPRRPDPDRR
jgi:thioredoxin 1